MNGMSTANAIRSWGVCLAGFCTQLITVFSLNALSMTMASMALDFGVKATDFAIAASIYGVLVSGMGLVWGYAVDHIGIRLTMIIGSLGAAIMLFLCGTFGNSVTSIVVLYSGAALFVAAMGMATTPKLIRTWFNAKWVGKALALVSAGGTIAGIVVGIILPPAIESGGWSMGFYIIAALIVVCSIVMVIFVKDDPYKMGMVPFGDDPSTAKAPVKEEKKVLTEEKKAAKRKANIDALLGVLKNPMLWAVGLVWLLYQGIAYTNTTYMVVTIKEAGWALALAGIASSTMRTAQTFGNIGWGAISDFLSRKVTVLVLGILAGIVWIAMFFVLSDPEASPFGDSSIFVMMVALGLTFCFIPVLNSMNTDVFPKETLGTCSGVTTALQLVGRFSFPLIAAAIIEAAGPYNAYFFFCGIGIMVVGALGFFIIPSKKKLAEKQAAEKKNLD